MVEIEGVVEQIVYKNDENGYTVARIKQNKDIISVVGYTPFLNEGQRVKVRGEWTVHPTFGQQIKAESCEEIVPTTLEGIERYLASGLIKGIGPATAKRIVEKFGRDSLDIIEMNPDKLTEIEGIGKKKAETISEAFKDQRELRNVMVFLQSYGISPTYSVKIFKKYGDKTIGTVKENPYKLCDDISGIGFKTADKIARNLGIDPNSRYRIMAGIKYILASCTNNGHVYYPKLTLYDECAKLLGVDVDLIDDALIALITGKQVVVEQDSEDVAVYLSPMYFAELGVSKRLLELSIQSSDEEFEGIDDEINEYEEENNINLAREQRDAVTEGVRNGVCIITGGPGTGKTTIIKCIINIFEKRGMNIVLAAPTGRAAKRMTEATEHESSTIHRLLQMEYIPGEGNSPQFSKDEGDTIEADAIIIDEASMIDIILMNSLLKAIAPGTRLILVGDVDQLPSVGPGNVLRDIIDSRAINVVKLSKVFRQANESLIAVNAHKINHGELPILNDRDKDFFFIQRSNPTEVLEDILKLVDVRLPSFKENIDPLHDIQVIAPMRKGETGIHNLNTRLQEILNAPSKYKAEKTFRDYTFRVGDKVMQIKNNYNIGWESISGGDEHGSGVFNGDIGYIESIDNENQSLNIIFDEDRRVSYDFTSLDELELAYAITIHKSQGSEFPVVVIPVCYGPPMLMTRNLIYTAVTRARKLVVLVGNRQVLASMIGNNRITERYTNLKNRIINIVNLIK